MDEVTCFVNAYKGDSDKIDSVENGICQLRDRLAKKNSQMVPFRLTSIVNSYSLVYLTLFCRHRIGTNLAQTLVTCLLMEDLMLR